MNHLMLLVVHDILDNNLARHALFHLNYTICMKKMEKTVQVIICNFSELNSFNIGFSFYLKYVVHRLKVNHNDKSLV